MCCVLVAQQISIDVDLVVFNVAVLDSKARSVKGLSKGNIRLFEDGSRNKLDLRVQLPAEQLPILGDRAALKRVLLVLVDNAIKFTSAPGRVAVRARDARGQVAVEVEDTGVGIPDKDLPRIFDRFYQADSSRSSGGAGVGLSIAHCIVQGTMEGSKFSPVLIRDPWFESFYQLNGREFGVVASFEV